MDREQFYALMQSDETLDYEAYLNCRTLLGCQKPFDQLSNRDELQFQIVHQVEELWMKLAAFTLLEIDEQMAQRQTFRVLTLFERVNRVLRLMTRQLELLETMSPKDYQTIRLQLGNGSGQESPGFRVLLRMPPFLWRTFKAHYLEPQGRTVESIYDSQYAHDEPYAVAEALVEFDERFQKFRADHIQLIHRSIGMGASSLKGRPVELLEAGARHQFFPELWAIRSQMTDRWGASYGRVRESIAGQSSEDAAPASGCPFNHQAF